MKNKYQIACICVGILFMFSLIDGLSIDMKIPSHFSLREEISFNYTFFSYSDMNITFISDIMCPNVPRALFQEKTIYFQANEPYTDTYIDQIVQDWFEPQNCTAYVQILSPIKMVVSKNFSIITNPSFSVSKKAPVAKAFVKMAKVYAVGENVYIDYEADIPGATISAVLTYPNKQTKTITFPITIKASQIGVYSVDITASKIGYKTITEKSEFGVISRNANIKQVQPSSLTGRVIGNDFNMKIAFGVVLLVVIIISLLIFFLKKSRETKKRNI